MMPSLDFDHAVLLLWIPLACWLFFRPHQFVHGGADAGVYVNIAANIAETGRLLIDDATLADLDPALYPTLLRAEATNADVDYLRFPAFFITDQSGQITPQFYPLHPVWQAVAYGIGGVHAALWLNGLWAIVGSLAVFLTARSLFGRKAATLTLAALTVNALQIWFGRYPTTEALTQALFWGGMWALARWLGQPKTPRLWAVLGGLLLGSTLLVRIDMFFLLAIPFALITFWLITPDHRWNPPALMWFVTPFMLLAVHTYVHAQWQSRPYFNSVFGYAQTLTGDLGQLFAAIPALFLLVLLIGRFVGGRAGPIFKQLNQPLRIAAVALLLVGAAYAWFIRPNQPIDSYTDWFGGGTIYKTDHENLRRIGWYFSPLGVLLSALGAAHLIWRLERRTLFLVGSGLLFSILYIWRISANPHQIYAMRRYVPVAMPFMLLAASSLVIWLSQRAHALVDMHGRVRPRERVRQAAWLLAVVWLGWSAFSMRGFLSQRDFYGAPEQIATLAAQVEPNAIIIFEDERAVGHGDILGTPLQYQFGIDVFTIRDTSLVERNALVAQVRRWQADNRPIYWATPADTVASDWFTLEAPQPYNVTSIALEGRYDIKPTVLLERNWHGTIQRVEPLP